MEDLIHLDEKLILLNVQDASKEEVIKSLFYHMRNQNYVKETFIEAILERERLYPTGLPLAQFGVAIPHTDPEHVLSPTIGVAVLQSPVEFRMMGNSEAIVNAEIVMVLAIKDPSKQIVMLERLMMVFQNTVIMKFIKNAETEREIVDLLNKELNQVGV